MTRYDVLKPLNSLNLYITPSTIIPSPTDDDYKRGYITRNFVQEVVNKNSHIYEVSDSDYIKYLTNPLYIAVKIRWRLIGNDLEVKQSNQKSIMTVSDKLPNLKNYLLNLIQFIKK